MAKTYRTPKKKPVCESARAWLKLRRGRQCLAPLTGGTSRLFSAYLHLVGCWVSTPDEDIEAALRIIVARLQRAEWPLAAEAIAHLGDWSHIPELWRRIKPRGAPIYVYVPSSDRVVAIADPDEESDTSTRPAV